MTNFKSIMGGAIWSLIAASLIFTALEPVKLEGRGASVIHSS